ncbi:MAG: hypothetical protein H6733_07800 [Alphaproteobacteria bacterium]|nr:hypothetical protein [Alphaproteobacteria bacterium]
MADVRLRPKGRVARRRAASWGVLLAAWLPVGAHAGRPATVPDGVRPVAAPWDAPERYARWAEAHGRPGATLPCVTIVAPLLRVCAQVRQGRQQRWVDSRDLDTWGLPWTEVVAALRERAAAHARDGGRYVTIAGMEDARYWLAADGTGWEAAAFLAPEPLARHLGAAPLFVAAPNVGVTVAWAGRQRADVDVAMAVGVAEMVEQQALPVAADVLAWVDGAWVRWGRAVRRGGGWSAPETQDAAPADRSGVDGAEGDRTPDL